MYNIILLHLKTLLFSKVGMRWFKIMIWHIVQPLNHPIVLDEEIIHLF